MFNFDNVVRTIIFSLFFSVVLSACGGTSSNGDNNIPPGNIKKVVVNECGEINIPKKCILYEMYDKKEGYWFDIESQKFGFFEDTVSYEITIKEVPLWGDEMVVYTTSESKFSEDIPIFVCMMDKCIYAETGAVLLTNLDSYSDVWGDVKITIEVVRPPGYYWGPDNEFTLSFEYEK